ncbi:TetR family transcriptional regulator [Nocardia cyriacigeorgica]|uniref:TetR family transcriptional regulator n=1 Tax=Nocardia cyriacigeorgica TaxID=135487 RepID=A0A6P1D4Z3_9NOCA|nr:TetR/AcrR family transcriptional regulator C-terminal domain-containing protein [Nocardia cyriacigeorgica]NEW42132.1 TetR family transcriptional regulator [Nocardia cyriacigeorgica]NEW44531.1 TetR family transcriptional regulator [Nocardia cyriacigeorgica]NEW53150.1 TetR family transcriptional regulator [Nocardia cyriacigeorgica]NEW55909.1 TetR family transcriptional regulator [Nocardia cyriacigeorgica]
MSRDTLTSEQIVATAIELLDEEGLDGLNMRSLGKRLDAAATAMYWHVKNKDNLVRLAADAVWAEVDLPDLSTMDWRTAAETMATGMYTMITTHPWLVQAQSSYLLYGPNKSRHDDHVLAVYDEAGFDEADADNAAATVFMFVLGNAVGAAANVSLHRRLAQKGNDPEHELREAMTAATDVAAQFPRLRRRIESAAASTGYNAAPDSGFTFGLTTLLDGLRDRLAASESA